MFPQLTHLGNGPLVGPKQCITRIEFLLVITIYISLVCTTYSWCCFLPISRPSRMVSTNLQLLVSNGCNSENGDNDDLNRKIKDETSQNFDDQIDGVGGSTSESSTSPPSSIDLTDRFKYKVNALMGTFDPIDAATDTEYVQGNILNALLTFPVSYTFHVVGKTSGDETLQSTFVQEVKDVVKNNTSNDDDLTYQVTPRGAKYTKVSIEKQVLNSEEIALIYTQLSNLELSVMQF